MKKDVKQFIQRVKAVGVEVKPQANGHWRMLYQGSFVGTLPATPGDGRWRENAITAMRLLGVDLIELEKTRRTKKKDAGGQSPPPLPVIRKVRPMANVVTVEGDLKQRLLEIAEMIHAEITEHYGLKPRKGRLTSHGFAPKLHKVVYAYHQTSGKPVPHLNYSRLYDTADMDEMARLLAGKISDIASGVLAGEDQTITTISKEQLTYARAAWAWFKYTFPDEEPQTIDKSEMIEEPELAVASEDVETAVSINGHSEDLAVAVRAIFLMGQSHYPDLDEIERIGMRLIDNALR